MVRRRSEPSEAGENRLGASVAIVEAWSKIKVSTKWVLTVLAVSAAIGLGSSAASAGPCSPTITPGENIARVVAGCSGSTTFTIKDGSYRLSGPINVSSGDVFKGVYSDKTRPTIDANGAEAAFKVGGTNGVRISGLDISGADGGNYCAPACGKAIAGDGTNLQVSDVRIHHNANQGIGNPGNGFILENSEIDNNGSYPFTALDKRSKSEPSSAAGIKILNAGTFRNNEIHDNFWTGIWCDNRGGPIVVTGNRIYDNGKAGIQYEICTGKSVIKDNVVTHNGFIDGDGGSPRAGIVLQDAQGVEVSYNTVRDHPRYGIHAVQGNRQRTFGVEIHHNRLTNDAVQGCQLSGINCYSN